MNDRVFTQTNLVFTGRLRDNKEKGHDTSKPRTAIEKTDLEKLFNDYFSSTSGDHLNTKILLHKVFFDIIYYTGRRGKEGLRNLNKKSFQISTGADNIEFIKITFNEKTKKNQGDSTSSGADSLHNDHHVITAIPDNPLCPVESFKRYMSLLNPDINAFFQHPDKKKTGFTKEPIGKNSLGQLMKEISKDAQLSREYTNHQIRKTTATGMHRSGFTLEEIANVTKHKNLDSLKQYVDTPTLTEKENYNKGLFAYSNRENQTKRPSTEEETCVTNKKKPPQEEILKNREVALNQTQPQTSQEGAIDVCNVVTNQLRQAPNLFSNATFNNCNFNFTLPQ